MDVCKFGQYINEVKGDKMKLIDFKSMLIGILTCACIFLIMGQTSDNQIGRYQLSTSLSEGNGVWIHETILDTQTGEVAKRDSYHQLLYNQHIK